jgi:hypothetical protein
VKSLVLSRLSELHKDQLIARSHYTQDLKELTFFIHQSKPSSLKGSSTVKQQLLRKISELGGSSALRFREKATDFVVVDPEVIAGQRASELTVFSVVEKCL